ncbi:hypothetical protein [Nocardioides pelophilus]|uniref:hypothetical protein n=1 Tax=Nocardioides pelophilus TaxID=2172019 RepID=UPI00160097E4|nr:hypothetical protein [Nocardioides pelophilus]
MSERLRHLGGHLRRHGIAYAALTVAFSFSPMPSMAADLVTTGEIANGAVTQPKLAADSVVGGKILNETVTGVDIKNGAVGSGDLTDGSVAGVDVKNGSIEAVDLSPTATGARVIRYDLGSFNFASGDLLRKLPGVWDEATVARSSWSVTMNGDSGYVISLPGHFFDGVRHDFVVNKLGSVLITDSGQAVDRVFTDISVYRTIPTSTVTVPAP